MIAQKAWAEPKCRNCGKASVYRAAQLCGFCERQKEEGDRRRGGRRGLFPWGVAVSAAVVLGLLAWCLA